MDVNAPTVPSAGPTSAAEKVHKVELLISTLLRVGVITSLCVVALGLIVTFARHPDYFSSAEPLDRLTKPGGEFPRSVGGILAGLRQFEGRSIVMLGVMLLVATPVFRVAVSVFTFVYQKDRAFVIITSVVLALLLLSFYLGRVEG